MGHLTDACLVSGAPDSSMARCGALSSDAFGNLGNLDNYLPAQFFADLMPRLMEDADSRVAHFDTLLRCETLLDAPLEAGRERGPEWSGQPNPKRGFEPRVRFQSKCAGPSYPGYIKCPVRSLRVPVRQLTGPAPEWVWLLGHSTDHRARDAETS
jgi:hypothetical protein